MRATDCGQQEWADRLSVGGLTQSAPRGGVCNSVTVAAHGRAIAPRSLRLSATIMQHVAFCSAPARALRTARLQQVTLVEDLLEDTRTERAIGSIIVRCGAQLPAALPAFPILSIAYSACLPVGHRALVAPLPVASLEKQCSSARTACSP